MSLEHLLWAASEQPSHFIGTSISTKWLEQTAQFESDISSKQ